MGKKKIRNRLPFFNNRGTTEFFIDGEWMSLPAPEPGELCIPVWVDRRNRTSSFGLTNFYYNCVLIDPNTWTSLYLDLDQNPIVLFIEMVDEHETVPAHVPGVSEVPEIWDLVNCPARVLYKGKIYIASFDSWGPIS